MATPIKLQPEDLRNASDIEDGFPYRNDLVAYIVVSSDGVITNPHYIDERRAAVKALQEGDAQVFAVWPGRWRSDLFVIDDVDAFAAAFQPKQRS